jgi:hypothetical protein
MKFTKRTIAGAIAGAVLAGGAAFAAVTLWGSGDASVAATKSQGIVVDNVKLTKSLVPGSTAGATGDAYNPNDFKVKVTGIVVLDEGQVVTGCTAPADQGSVHLVTENTSVVTTQVNAAGATKQGRLYALAAPVTIDPKSKAPIAVASVVKQDAAAEAFCGFDAKLGVQAETAGN